MGKEITPQGIKDSLEQYGGECVDMAGTVVELKKDVGTLKVGQIELKSQMESFMQVFKIQFDSQNRIMEKLEESNNIHSKHITQLQKSNETVVLECSVKEKELILEIEKVRAESKEANLQQDLKCVKEKLKEEKTNFASRLWFKIQDKSIEIFIGLCIIGYMTFHELK